MKHENNHKLDVACLDCIRVHMEHKRRLMNFVREIADESVYEKYENINELNWKAFEILQEIGEEK